MHFFILIVMVLFSFSVFSEISLEELHGVDAMMKPSAGELRNNGKNIFSPIYGSLALKSGTLERIRVFGKYWKQSKDSEGNDIMPGFIEHPEWIHPAFQIKITNDPHAFKKQFEYPLDSISALIQWLFPSVDGNGLIANDRDNDPVAIMGLALRKWSDINSKKQCLIELDDQFKKNNVELSRSNQKIKKNPDVAQYFQENEQLQQKHDNLKKEIDCMKTDLKNMETLISLLRAIQEGSINATNANELMAKIYPQSKDKQKKTFTEILYHALVQDGTFAESHDTFYPRHIALHALIGYLCYMSDHRSQIVSLMRHAGLMNNVILREPSGVPNDADPTKIQSVFRGYSIRSKSKRKDSLYRHVKNKILSGKSVSFEEKAYAGYGYEVYEKPYPEKIQYSSSKVPDLYGVSAHKYADCGETMLRNFFNVCFGKKGGEFEDQFLDHFGNVGKVMEIKRFYQKFKNTFLQKKQEARDAWSEIVSNLNGEDHARQGYTTDVQYSKEKREDDKRYSNIDSGDWGIANVLNVIAKLMRDEILDEAWEYHPENIQGSLEKKEIFYAQIQKKLDRLCAIFSRDEDFYLNWTFEESGKKVSSVHGKFQFFINHKLIFCLNVSENHFDFSYLFKISNDWRKEDVHIEPVGLLSSFYSQNPSPFLNTLISEKYDETLKFWRESYQEYQIPLTLRMAYKVFGSQQEDENAQMMMIKMLSPIRHNVLGELSKDESPLISDFARMFLIERLRLHNRERATLFEYEFGITRETPNPDLHSVVKLGLIRTIESLITRGVNKDHKEMKYGFTPLMCAVVDGFTDIVKFLVRQGVNKEIKNVEGQNSLMLAASEGQDDIAEFLISSGARIDERDLYGCTPLMFAVIGGYSNIVRIIVKNGANRNIRHNYGSTPLMVAKEALKSSTREKENLEEIIQILENP